MNTKHFLNPFFILTTLVMGLLAPTPVFAQEIITPLSCKFIPHLYEDGVFMMDVKGATQGANVWIGYSYYWNEQYVTLPIASGRVLLDGTYPVRIEDGRPDATYWVSFDDGDSWACSAFLGGWGETQSPLAGGYSEPACRGFYGISRIDGSIQLKGYVQPGMFYEVSRNSEVLAIGESTGSGFIEITDSTPRQGNINLYILDLGPETCHAEAFAFAAPKPLAIEPSPTPEFAPPTPGISEVPQFVTTDDLVKLLALLVLVVLIYWLWPYFVGSMKWLWDNILWPLLGWMLVFVLIFFVVFLLALLITIVLIAQFWMIYQLAVFVVANWQAVLFLFVLPNMITATLAAVVLITLATLAALVARMFAPPQTIVIRERYFETRVIIERTEGRQQGRRRKKRSRRDYRMGDGPSDY